jgi:hypothetical protein
VSSVVPQSWAATGRSLTSAHGDRLSSECAPADRPDDAHRRAHLERDTRRPLAARPAARATTLVDEFPVSSFGGRLECVDVESAPVSGVEQAESNFGDLAGDVLIRSDEHLRSAVDDDGTLRVEMVGWVLELERETVVIAPLRLGPVSSLEALSAP